MKPCPKCEGLDVALLLARFSQLRFIVDQIATRGYCSNELVRRAEKVMKEMN